MTGRIHTRREFTALSPLYVLSVGPPCLVPGHIHCTIDPQSLRFRFPGVELSGHICRVWTALPSGHLQPKHVGVGPVVQDCSAVQWGSLLSRAHIPALHFCIPWQGFFFSSIPDRFCLRSLCPCTPVALMLLALACSQVWALTGVFLGKFQSLSVC